MLCKRFPFTFPTTGLCSKSFVWPAALDPLRPYVTPAAMRDTHIIIIILFLHTIGTLDRSLPNPHTHSQSAYHFKVPALCA